MEETYSARMLAAVLREVQQADARRLAELASYYLLRGGPGRALVEAELRWRLARRQTNYSSPNQAA